MADKKLNTLLRAFECIAKKYGGAVLEMYAFSRAATTAEDQADILAMYDADDQERYGQMQVELAETMTDLNFDSIEAQRVFLMSVVMPMIAGAI